MKDCTNAPLEGWWIFKKRNHWTLKTARTLNFTNNICVYCGAGIVDQRMSPNVGSIYVSPEKNLKDHREWGYKIDLDDLGRVTKIEAPNGTVVVVDFDSEGWAKVELITDASNITVVEK